ncbi:MAG: flagellar motor switch protein FliN [Planctomycetes bacterium]|nr:flagellar motor switch protein FliN [Planctomycetota bacterium]
MPDAPRNEPKGTVTSPAAPAKKEPASAAPLPTTPVPATPVPATPVPATPVPVAPVPTGQIEERMRLLDDVDVNVRVELGRSRLYISDVLRLGEGSVIELDKLAGDPVDVVVNGRLLARGEVLVLNDNFCVRITDIVDVEERSKGGGG